MLEFTILLFLLTFCAGHAILKLTDNSENESEIGNRVSLNSEEHFEDNSPLHESYRSKHKYKVGTGHQELNKRFTDINSSFKGLKDPQCGIMYRDNEPVGILQPFEESYRFLPIQGDSSLVELNRVPAKRRTVLDFLYPTEFTDEYGEDKLLNPAKFSDERYPSVFAKFKIDSRVKSDKVEPSAKKKSNFKRTAENKNELDPVGSELNNEEINSGIEENVDVKQKVGVEEKLKNILDDMGLIDEYPNQEVKREVEDENLELGTNRISLIKEGTVESRPRRQDYIQNQGTNSDLVNSDIVFGDSNNKQKFKRSENDMPVLECTLATLRDSQNEDYEKRVEREIREKIQQLKEEVKQEINNLTKSEDDIKRKKRQIVNTLMDEENNDINPNLNIDENEKIHIRKKRNTTFKDKFKDSSKKLTSIKRTKRDADNINSVDTYTDEEKAYGEYDKNHPFRNEDKYDCNCDKNDPNCKCDNSNSNTFEINKDFGTKSATKKSSKQVCNCDKGGHNCKCIIPVKDTIPSLADKNYSDYYDVEEDYNEDNKNSVKWNDDKQYFAENEYENDDYSNNDRYEKRAVKPRKFAVNKPMESGEYFVDFQPEVYRLSSGEYYRRKREKIDDLNLLNNGAHLVAIKQENMLPHSRYRRRILKEENNIAPRQLIDMSDEDLFGALPQSYDGELQRYKRIRRSQNTV